MTHRRRERLSASVFVAYLMRDRFQVRSLHSLSYRPILGNCQFLRCAIFSLSLLHIPSFLLSDHHILLLSHPFSPLPRHTPLHEFHNVSHFSNIFHPCVLFQYGSVLPQRSSLGPWQPFVRRHFLPC